MPMAARILPEAQQVHPSDRQDGTFIGDHHAGHVCSPHHSSMIEVAEPKAKRVCRSHVLAGTPLKSASPAADKKSGIKLVNESTAAMARAEE